MIRFPVLRNPTTAGSREVIEALEDTFNFLRSLLPLAVRKRTDQIYAPPFYIDTAGRQPEGVILIRAKVSRLPEYPSTGNVGWRWESSQLRIDTIPGLTVGTSYDLNFLIIG